MGTNPARRGIHFRKSLATRISFAPFFLPLFGVYLILEDHRSPPPPFRVILNHIEGTGRKEACSFVISPMFSFSLLFSVASFHMDLRFLVRKEGRNSHGNNSHFQSFSHMPVLFYCYDTNWWLVLAYGEALWCVFGCDLDWMIRKTKWTIV